MAEAFQQRIIRVTDIFHEVEEDVRRERLEQFWKKYSDYIIAGAAFLVIAAAGIQLWRVYEQREYVRASLAYTSGTQLMENGQLGPAATLFAKLAPVAPSGYAQLSLLQEADALSALGRTAQAVDLYKQVAARGDTLLAPAARLRVAWATLDTATRPQLVTLLGSMTDDDSPWHPLAREILAYVDLREGNSARATAEFHAIAIDPKTPDAARQRCKVMAGYLAAGGGANFGTVPEPPVAALAPKQPPAAASAGPQKP
jgi:hypothetical protein